jgi:GNAT superfamily N-acetyltransferase
MTETWFDLLFQSWPAAHITQQTPWCYRHTPGGGNRVNATTLVGDCTNADIAQAATDMRAHGQTPLFLLRPSDAALDKQLQNNGYRIKDETLLFYAPVTQLCAQPPERMTGFDLWPPLEIQRRIWAGAGIDQARIAIMERCHLPKTTILARHNDRPAGAAFVATNGETAVIHAIEVTPNLRRQGVGQNIIAKAAFWAAQNGAKTLTLAVTRQNRTALDFYSSLKMLRFGKYHYRIGDVSE